MVFKKDAKVDTFQRQISALRQQLGTEDEGLTPAPVVDRAAGYDAPAYDPVPTRAPASRFGAPIEPAYGVAEAPAPAYPEASLDPQSSVIAHDTTWKGDLQTDGSLHIHGKVEGTITAKSDVFIAEDAEVDATVTAENVAIAGIVRGSIRCSGRFEVLPAGRVNGDVHAPVLVVHEGATVNGRFSMASAETAISPLRARSAGA